MDSWIHPALFFFLGALLLPLIKGKAKKGIHPPRPGRCHRRGCHGQVRLLWRVQFHRRPGALRPRGQTQHGLRLGLRHHGLPGGAVRPPPRGGRPPHGRVLLRGGLARGDLRRRLPDALHLLGDHGLLVGLPDLVPQGEEIDRGRVPLPPVPRLRRAPVLHRDDALLRQDRELRLHQHPPRQRRLAGVPDPRRVRPERGGAAAPRLAPRRLPRGERGGGGVPLRLHHQDGGVRPGPRLLRVRDPGHHGDRDDRLRRLLRRDRKRHPPGPRLPHHQPGRLHGGGRRDRDRDGRQRRLGPRLRPHPVQGASLHGRGRGALRHRHGQAHAASAGCTNTCRSR